MRAVVYEAFGEPLELRDVPEPAVPRGGVVIHVEATGLCRSDWHGWMGHDADITVLPHVPGHELAGTVAETGPGVTRWKVGDRVTVPFVCACGVCGPCAAGDQQVCENQTQPGFTHWGSYAEYVAIENADVNLVGLPEDMTYETAAALGCRFATAFRAVLAQGRASAGQWVAVHGCGGVGLSAVMVAAAAGARVVAIDIAPAALDLARQCGAAVTLDGREAGDVAEAVRDVTGGGAHVSLDALGSPATAAASIGGLRRRGRHVQVGLLPPAAGRADLPMERVIAQELEIVGSHGMAAHAYGPMMDMVQAGTLRPGLLVSRTIGLADVPRALAAMSGAGFTMIRPRG
ncbi:zinc-dependent alcohol dehydrogenase family protein [Actinomadura barringtoniae]|uniref:Zinc-dependent alcohol dehydrogenase family protein n=1 Tax=Actinomadura barringtoniae TaxID=1427535 RepID=A0A939P886_9ACTN|nr:zinc-dependent alcohol dehydrogenase family protein [Actinomadura barringtoniae]MBO2447480.1 zinc-dependent alcohol dehydrogenase family protein [Actinomadura barringtoniae]